MPSDWEGRPEPFQIHAEGWALIIVVLMTLVGAVVVLI